MKPAFANDTYHGLLGLDKLPRAGKALNWTVCTILAACVAIFNYLNTQAALPANSPMRASLGWFALAFFSPVCIAMAWPRLTGVKWRHAFLLLIFVPVVYQGIMSLLEFLLSFFITD